MPLKPGDLLHGQYRILGQLGRGGFGFVYHALDTLINKPVAIKELIPALVGDPAILKRFLSEARATMDLRHDHIVATHTIFPENENYYIVMEYLPGGSLEDRLKQHGSLAVDDALRIAAEVCQALRYAHDRGIVHCDLKPANILFDSQDNAKLADFGIAHVSGQALTRSWQTPAGFVAGTLPYMSPEQADGCRDEPRTDLYALGAVLYRMLTGRTYLDFDQRDTPRAHSENIQRIYNEQPQPPSARNRHIPAWLDAAILTALSKNPAGRHPDALSLLAALSPPQPKPVPPHPEPRPESPPLASRRSARTPLPRWFWPAASAAVIFLIAVSIGLYALDQCQPPTPEPTFAAAEPTKTTTPTETTLIATPSATPEPPQPTRTHTPLPPTDTNTPMPATDTATLLPPTDTHTPTPIDTDTITSTGTNIPRPRNTNTPTPTPTPVFASVQTTYVGGFPNHYECLDALDPAGKVLDSVCCTPKFTTYCSIWWSYQLSPDSAKVAYFVNETAVAGVGYAGYVGVFWPIHRSLIPAGPALFEAGSPLYPGFAWNPKSSRVAYRSHHEGTSDVYVADLESGRSARLTSTSDNEHSISWLSSDRLQYCRLHDGTYETYQVNWDGTGTVKIQDSCITP